MTPDDEGRPCQSGRPSDTEQNFTAAECKPSAPQQWCAFCRTATARGVLYPSAPFDHAFRGVPYPMPGDWVACRRCSMLISRRAWQKIATIGIQDEVQRQRGTIYAVTTAEHHAQLRAATVGVLTAWHGHRTGEPVEIGGER